MSLNGSNGEPVQHGFTCCIRSHSNSRISIVAQVLRCPVPLYVSLIVHLCSIKLGCRMKLPAIGLFVSNRAERLTSQAHVPWITFPFTFSFAFLSRLAFCHSGDGDFARSSSFHQLSDFRPVGVSSSIFFLVADWYSLICVSRRPIPFRGSSLAPNGKLREPAANTIFRLANLGSKPVTSNRHNRNGCDTSMIVQLMWTLTVNRAGCTTCHKCSGTRGDRAQAMLSQHSVTRNIANTSPNTTTN